MTRDAWQRCNLCYQALVMMSYDKEASVVLLETIQVSGKPLIEWLDLQRKLIMGQFEKTIDFETALNTIEQFSQAAPQPDSPIVRIATPS